MSTLLLRRVVRCGMLVKVVIAGKEHCHMLRLPVSTASKVRFGKSMAAWLPHLVINTTLLIEQGQCREVTVLSVLCLHCTH